MPFASPSAKPLCGLLCHYTRLCPKWPYRTFSKHRRAFPQRPLLRAQRPLQQVSRAKQRHRANNAPPGEAALFGAAMGAVARPPLDLLCADPTTLRFLPVFPVTSSQLFLPFPLPVRFTLLKLKGLKIAYMVYFMLPDLPIQFNLK